MEAKLTHIFKSQNCLYLMIDQRYKVDSRENSMLAMYSFLDMGYRATEVSWDKGF